MEQKRVVLEQEGRLAFNVPALWTERFVVSTFDQGLVRAAFGEIAPGETKVFQWHSAIIMPISAAQAFRNALTDTMTKYEQLLRRHGPSSTPPPSR